MHGWTRWIQYISTDINCQGQEILPGNLSISNQFLKQSCVAIWFLFLAIIIVFVDIARRFHTFHYPINSMSDFQRISSSLALGGHPNIQAMWIISPWQWSNSLYLPLSLFHFGQLDSQSLSTLYKSHDIAAGILDKELRNPCFLSLEPVSPKFSL